VGVCDLGLELWNYCISLKKEGEVCHLGLAVSLLGLWDFCEQAVSLEKKNEAIARGKKREEIKKKEGNTSF
jgi:hypothetical protein